MKAVALAALFGLLAFDATAAEKGYGKAMPEGGATALSQAIASGKNRDPAKWSGRVTQVCQKQGCWFMIEDEGLAARVMIKDHAFAVPKDAQGRAVVYGRLFRQNLSLDDARHYAADSGAPLPKSADAEWRVLASSVLLLEAPEPKKG